MGFLSKFLRVIPVLAAGMALDQVRAAAPVEVRCGVHVRPLLSHYCIQCHGPDEGQRKAKLRLDTRDGLFGGSGDERIVVPGKTAESLLYQKITSHDLDDRMPPSETKKELAEEEIATIRRWIEQGAEWEGHWAFVTQKR